MISFDFQIFVIQLIIFIFFLLFASRFIVKPVLAMSDKRKGMLSDGRSAAEKAEKQVSDYLGIYEMSMKSAHKEGSLMISNARLKAEEERFNLTQEEKKKAEEFLSENRMKMGETAATLGQGLRKHEEELVLMICEKLWGSR